MIDLEKMAKEHERLKVKCGNLRKKFANIKKH